MIPLKQWIQSFRTTIQNNNFSKASITGDINCNFLKNSPHVNYVNNFLEKNSFIKSWENFHVDYTHVHEANGITYTSILDHFFCSQSLDNEMIEAGVIHHVDNKSDHEPIYCVMKLGDSIEPTQSQKENAFRKPKPSWNKSTPEQKEKFKLDIATNLGNIQVPQSASNCFNVKCKQDNHIQETDKFVSDTTYYGSFGKIC